ncbi:MAG: leucine-rich repeat protein [Paludibacteraceae bacterium]|nr:leucine-rich repeat protein [Paludibacteraceae bacterium]
MRKTFTTLFLLLITCCVASAANYLTFTAMVDGAYFSKSVTGSANPNIEYSLDDGQTWTELAKKAVTLEKVGDKALLRGFNPEGFSFGINSYTSFVLNSPIAASGSVMSLIDGVGETDTIPNARCFYRLFYKCPGLTFVPELPATTLAESCYVEMFNNCEISYAPALPATKLAKDCYNSMFDGCSYLKQAPELPATTLAEGCYQNMFRKCRNITSAPALPAMELANKCYSGMFNGCTGLKQAPELPATTLDSACYFGMFSGCTGLTQAPELPATTMGNACYKEMFYGCTGLTQTPELPATTLDIGCYNGMFYGCTGLTQAPELSVTELADGCYSRMFYGCTGLTQAPELPATTLSSYCYDGMFYGCTNLTQAPALPATTLSASCYAYMFRGCAGLTQAPELPATELTEACYMYMFYGCTGLTQAPELPAATLVKDCYAYMFDYCKNISQIKVNFTEWMEWDPERRYGDAGSWVYSVARNGTFICPKALPQQYDEYGRKIPARWTAQYIDAEDPDTTSCIAWMDNLTIHVTRAEGLVEVYNLDGELVHSAQASTTDTTSFTMPDYGAYFVKNDTNTVEVCLYNYLTFTAGVDSCRFAIRRKSSLPCNITYSLDHGQTWSIYFFSDTITLAKKGDKVLLRGNNPNGVSLSYDVNVTSPERYIHFDIIDSIAASGSVMSLIDSTGRKDTIPSQWCFYGLFAGCDKLTQAPELPATTLAGHCYQNMFQGCSSLKQAPVLPATTLTDYCYQNMFYGCSSLTQAPALPAIALAPSCYFGMFSQCTGLTQAPALPATTLAYYCYADMFKGCTNLTQAPELPATTLANSCYVAMFADCENLSQAPALPATRLFNYCYQSMFEGCTSLTQAPALPATTMAYYCYCRMFERCRGLTQAPELPALKLHNGCYSLMFAGCTSLTQAPELPATTLVDECYKYMFKNCTGLTQAPELPATKLVTACYGHMFDGCSNLSFIKVNFTNWVTWYSDTDDEDTWVKNVAPTGTFICPKDLTVQYGVNRIPEGWNVQFIKEEVVFSAWGEDLTLRVVGAEGLVEVYDANGELLHNAQASFEDTTSFLMPDYGVYVVKTDSDSVRVSLYNYLTLTPERVGLGFSVESNTWPTSMDFPTIQYSLDNGRTWDTLSVGHEISLEKKGAKVLLRGDNPDGFSQSSNAYVYFKLRGSFSASGSVMSLVDSTATSMVVPTSGCFYGLFQNCTSLTQAPELPATTLADSCYAKMFNGCTSLTQAPELPATTLAKYCYDGIFSGCTSLTQAPELSATTLADYCYRNMFSGCTSLTQAPVLAVTSLVAGCYYGMFSGCTGLTQTPELPATTLANSCYYEMFMGCANLTQAPELSATTLAANCYAGMFEECRILPQAPVLPATTLAYGCYSRMFYNCDSLTQTPELPATTLAGSCYEAMFSACNKLTQAPVLPATTLAPFCYKNMFSGCLSFTQAPELPATTMEHSCYYGMFDNCPKLTQAPALPATKLSEYCYAFMFSRCSTITQAPEMSATDFAEFSCQYMFNSCTSLTQAPELLATTMPDYSLTLMFNDCENLSYIKVHFTEWAMWDEVYNTWVAGVAPAGTFVCPRELPVKYGEGRIPVGWEVRYIGEGEVPDSVSFSVWTEDRTIHVIGAEGLIEVYDANGELLQNAQATTDTTSFLMPDYGVYVVKSDTDSVRVVLCDYLTFTAEQDGANFTLKYKLNYNSLNPNEEKPNLLYSLDGGKSWIRATYGEAVILKNKGDKALLKGINLEGFSRSSDGYAYFELRGSIAASGSVMSLISDTADSDVIPNAGCFYGLFYNCSSLKQAPKLPATTLTESCYAEMFYGCRGLTEAPELPATTLVNNCYQEMFYGCKGLTRTPDLPATTLADYCYSDMFRNCTSLTQIVALPVTTLAGYCYNGMFRGCTALTQAPELPADTLAVGCYTDMFNSCSSLTQTPELSSTTLAKNCYYGMFKECTNLTQAPVLPATTLAGNCYYRMFEGCLSLTQAPELPATTLAYGCYYEMFKSCVGLTQAPLLPSTQMAGHCYRGMFSGCTGLTQAPELPATTLAGYCYYGMFDNCVSLSQAPALPATKLAEYCYAFMFSRCSTLTQAPVMSATDFVEFSCQYMFNSCTSLTQAPELLATTMPDYSCMLMFNDCGNLSYIKVHFTEWPKWEDEAIYDKWVVDVAPSGTFVCPRELAVEYGVNRIPEGWEVQFIEPEIVDANYLTFTVLEDSSSITATDVKGEDAGKLRSLSLKDTDLRYSLDGGKTWNVMENGVPVLLPKAGDSVMLKGYNPDGLSNYTDRIRFEMRGKLAASGSVMSLIDNSGKTTDIPNSYCFANLFDGCGSLTQAPELPSTVLKPHCYFAMFRNCTSLQSVSMLPAAELTEGCYEEMFYGCENLSEIEVAFTDWADGTTDWMYGVAPSGTFTCPDALAEKMSASNIPEGWLLPSGEEVTNEEDTASCGISVWTENGTICVRGAEGAIEVFGVKGELIRTLRGNASGTVRFNMPAGRVYILKIGAQRVKVLL